MDILGRIIDIEGEYTNDPRDSGGATRYGVTEATARQYGYTGDMRDLPKPEAHAILSAMFWQPVKGDELLAISPLLAYEVVDTAVNMGARRATLFLQRALNVFNDRGDAYAELLPDGILGPATMCALHAFHTFREDEGIEVLVRLLNCMQGAFYVEIAERREKDEAFIYGWIKNRVKI